MVYDFFAGMGFNFVVGNYTLRIYNGDNTSYIRKFYTLAVEDIAAK